MNISLPSLERLRARGGAKWQAYGPEVLPAWVADMDFEIADGIRTALEETIACNSLGYTLPFERAALDQVFCARLRARFDWEVAPAQVEFFSDVVQAIYLALLTLTDPGDGVLTTTPIYPPFLGAVAETGRRADLCPLVCGPCGYEIDFDALDRAVDGRTRLMLLCHPHNPTGRAFRRAELEQLAQFALARDLWVVADEIHADLMLDARTHLPFAALGPEIAARTLTLTSPSKPFNIAGLCLAAGVFGSAALRSRFHALPPHVRGGRSAFGLAGAHAAWTVGQPWLDAVLTQLRANRAQVADFVRTKWPDVVHFPPEATYLAWLDFRALELGIDPQHFFLAKAHVALGEGPAFGVPGEGFARLNFATTPAILDMVLARMDAALRAR